MRLKCSRTEHFVWQTVVMRADRLVATLLADAVPRASDRRRAGRRAGDLRGHRPPRPRGAVRRRGPGVPAARARGGWQLVGGARTDLSGLTAAEAQALFLLAGPSASIAPEVKSALRKLVRALPGTFRADAEAAADAVVIDSARWGERENSRPPWSDLQTAVVRRRKVRLSYVGRPGRRAAADRAMGSGRQERCLVPDRRHRRASGRSGSTGSLTPL